MARRGALLLVATVLGVCAAGSARGYNGGPITDQIESLFWLITFFAVLVGIVVFGILFWFLYRYRQSVSPNPATEVHGNRRLEVVWTVVPTIILIIITAVSWPVLLYTDTPPPADTTVTVIGERFSWTFRYADNSTSPDLWVQQNIVVALRVTSIDVIHSFAVPDLGIKIDAIPGRMNPFWLQAHATGNYLVQCAEFCGVSHPYMRSTVHVFPPGSQPKIYGPPPPPASVTEIQLLEPSATNWTINPANLTAKLGDRVTLRVWNNATNPHDFRIDAPVNASVSTMPPFGFAWLNFTVNTASPGPVPYGPSNATARTKGMAGNLTIQAGTVITILLGEDPPGSSNFVIRPNVGTNPLTIAKGEKVVFEIVNVGQFDHNFQMGPPYDFIIHTSPIKHGDPPIFLGPFTLDQDATSQYWCIIHKGAGMIAPYVVGAGSAQVGVPLFDMVALTIGVSVPVMFAYVIHHARRRDEQPASAP